MIAQPSRMDEKSQAPRAGRKRDLPVWICLGWPVGTLVICWLTPLLGWERWHQFMGHQELSFLEITTVVFLLPAFVLGIMCSIRFRRARWLPRRQARAIAIVMCIGALGALYFGGEEMSWGQSYLRWETPEAWAKINKQNESNLHNLQLDKYGPWVAWIDDVVNNAPRQVLLGIAVLGAALPLVLIRRRETEKARASIWYWLVPTWRLVPICALAVGSTIPEKIAKAIRHHYDIWPVYDSYVRMAFISPGGELKEYCYGMMILFYFWSLLLRTAGRSQAAPAAPEAETPDK